MHPPPRRAWALALALVSPAGGCFIDFGNNDPSAISPDSGSSGSGPTDTSAGTGAGTGAGTSTGDIGDTTGTTDPTGDPDSTGIATTGVDDATTGACEVPWYADIDGDGHGGPEHQEGCGAAPPGFTLVFDDCDDTDPEVHPGADELCDGADNDCDLGIDEWPAGVGGACNGCSGHMYEEHYYEFCEAPQRTWEAARAHCQQMLGDLVIVDDESEYNFILEQFGVNDFTTRVWIGLTDAVSEDDFAWVDRSPLGLGFAPWLKGEPNNIASDAPGPANCVALVEELFQDGWRDQTCTSMRAFVCESAIF